MQKAHGKTLIIENNNNNTMINSLINNGNNNDNDSESMLDSNGMAIDPTEQQTFNSSINLNETYFASKVVDRVICDICNKQVCNKYFLRTHKAKVHGIYETPYQQSNNKFSMHNSMNTGTAMSMNMCSQNMNTSKSMEENNYDDYYDEDELEEGEERMVTHVNGKYSGLDDGEVVVDPNTKKRYINSNMVKKELGEIVSIKNEADYDAENSKQNRRTSSCSTNSSNISHNQAGNTINSNNNKNIHQNGLVQINSPLSSSYSTPLSPTSSSSKEINTFSCQICKRTFQSKKFLEDHMINTHGVNDVDKCIMGMDNDEYNEDMPEDDLIDDQDDDDIDYLDSLKNKNKLKNKFKKLNRLSNTLPAMQQQQQQHQQQHNQHHQQRMTINQNKFNQSSLNPGRVICNICNKELCNKYFLRQHVSHRHKLTFDEYLEKYEDPATSHLFYLKVK